ncbi:GNAT family N-acetyltransferase [Photobacterium swingsii]|uniref:N-acetyltransferase n=1 Tax=Photobacterium swingsii TaxID=680026 RepID=A0A0J8VCD7_9GAMM|nr:GNAT family N-acetyltransferase [Photobacterium swingsii]KMV30976.1 histone acetyltransferase [Photobacterium swingsii]PSW23459.1 N-acetyltransferase [Photobacterium swingsii]
MEFSLQAASEHDIAFLLKLREATMKQYLEDVGEPTTTEAYLERVMYKFEDAKVIKVHGESAGLFKVSYIPENNQWYVVQIQLHPGYQNHRIGRQLLTELISVATEQGASVGLSVLKTNPAKRLYTRLGFEPVGETKTEFKMEYNA